MSAFPPPQYSGSYGQRAAMQPVSSGGAGAEGGGGPPSPIKGLGYVGGASNSGSSGLNGYVGEKPPTREEPQNSQSLRRHTNLGERINNCFL
jgi:hypothetical protein